MAGVAPDIDVDFSEDEVDAATHERITALEIDAFKAISNARPALLESLAHDSDGFPVPASVRRAAKRTLHRDKQAAAVRELRDMQTDSAADVADRIKSSKRVISALERRDAAKIRGIASLSVGGEAVMSGAERAKPMRVPGRPFGEARRLAEEARTGSRKQQPGSLTMLDFARRRLRADYAESSRRTQRMRIHERWETALPEIQNQFGSGRECEGDVRVAAMEKALDYLDSVGYERSKQQKVMHTAMIVLSLKSYYGRDLEQHLVRLLRKYNLSELRTEGIFLAPRRFGKSVSVAMFAACELVTQPTRIEGEIGHDVLIYSNNHRASKMLLLMVHKLVCILAACPDFGGTVIQLDKNESMSFQLADEKTVNQLFAYPANEEKLRGTGSKACTNTSIAEEFAYMPPDLLFKIIGPTLTRVGVKFIGITNVKGTDSFITPLAEARYPDGRPIMLTLNFELVCGPCKKAGRAHLCRCKEADIPPWQKRSQHGKLKLLMGSGNLNTFMEEIKGVSIEEKTSSAFCQSSVAWLRTEEAVIAQDAFYADTVYTAVDPACGGKYSKFAIVSAVWHQGRMVVSYTRDPGSTPRKNASRSASK